MQAEAERRLSPAERAEMWHAAGAEAMRLAVLRLVAGDFELEAEVRRLQVDGPSGVKSGEETPRSK